MRGGTVLYLFEQFGLDDDRRELRGAGIVPIEPQVFDLLVYLIKNRNRSDYIGLERPRRFRFNARQPHQRCAQGTWRQRPRAKICSHICSQGYSFHRRGH
jgi:hypothetical protein